MKEVPEDSDEAKKWPRWQPFSQETPSSSASISEHSSAYLPLGSGTSSPASLSTATPNPPAVKPTKKPGPRKSKITLASQSSTQKAKKLTTLDKSAMDWRSHVGRGETSDLKDELEANRRGGGYLEKVEFLQRVEDRKEDALEANKTGKRRR